MVISVAAFHIKWDESILEKNIANWSVNIIQLSRSKRHLDRAKLMNFWEILDKWVPASMLLCRCCSDLVQLGYFEAD